MKSDYKSLVDRKVGTRIAKMLSDSQHEYGYLTNSEIERIADHVGEPLNVIQNVISFFPHYRRTPPPKCTVEICRDMSCRLRGAAEAIRKLNDFKQECDVRSSSRESAIEIHEASCLGRCDRGPAALVNEKLYVERTADELVEIVSNAIDEKETLPDSDLTTAREAIARGEIDCYLGKPKSEKYAAVKMYTENPNPEIVIDTLKRAGLVGMGGAGAPTFQKWKDARQADGTAKFIVCNADESEPGTFKDRDLLLGAPHLIIEGMIMAGLVIEAQQGFIYVRHEYYEQIAALEAAIKEAEFMGMCGQNINGKGRSFSLEVFISPGGYVCGEQTALIEALEGKRSEPRNRPPELETNGLYDQPTVLNNVETFAWVPSILLRKPSQKMVDAEIQNLEAEVQKTNSELDKLARDPDAKKLDDLSKVLESLKVDKKRLQEINWDDDNRNQEFLTASVWYKHSGSKRAYGKRFFSISGDVAKPGAYEVPNGITLGELINDYAGGMRDGVELQAVALSGPSGGFLSRWLPEKAIRRPKQSDQQGKPTGDDKYPIWVDNKIDITLLPLDIGVSRELGYLVGAGIVIYGSEADMMDQAAACSRFFQKESCGKCVPCRLGTRKIADLAAKFEQLPSEQLGNEILGNVELLDSVMREPGVCICALGASASSPLATYIKYFSSTSTTPKT